jgi:hypothetical protein
MTTDRDDPERGPSPEDRFAKPLAGFEAGDRELVAWALSAVGASLLQEGLSSPELLQIARDSLRHYRKNREVAGDPRAVLVDAILRRARRHIQLRGVESPSAQQRRREPPHILDLIAIREAMDTLSKDERKLLYMIYFEKKSLETIAEVLDVAVAYVEIRAQRAVEKLWRWLQTQRPKA